MLTFLYGVLICRMFLIYATLFDLTMVAGGRTGCYTEALRWYRSSSTLKCTFFELTHSLLGLLQSDNFIPHIRWFYLGFPVNVKLFPSSVGNLIITLVLRVGYIIDLTGLG